MEIIALMPVRVGKRGDEGEEEGKLMEMRGEKRESLTKVRKWRHRVEYGN